MRRTILFCLMIFFTDVEAWSTPLAYGVLATSQFPLPARSDLYTVDLGTGAMTLVGPTGLFVMGGVALSPSNQLFGTDLNGDFYSINTSTGAATLIGSTGRGFIDGLDFNGNTLLATDFGSAVATIFSIDTATGATTTITTALSPTGFVGAMAVLDADTVLVSANGTGAGPALYSISLRTGAVNTIGLFNTMGAVAAMDFLSDGNLYGVDSSAFRYLIDPKTAATTNLGTLPITFFRQALLDMTPISAAGVPGPSSLILLATGLVSLASTKVLRRDFRRQLRRRMHQGFREG